VISVLPPKIATEMARPWLTARSPIDAVRELLGYAESAEPDQRMVALALAREIGPAAVQAWRESAGRPGFGAYARRWLAGQGEPVAEDPRDEAWLTVEAMSLASAAELKEILADPDHEQHEEMLEWLGLDDAAEFDPAEFSVDEVNERLTVLR
jgi:Plasmid pRiA4b ORF-3-like protein